MIAAFLGLSSWKKIVDIVVVLAVVGGIAWIYFALANRAAEIKSLTNENAQLATAATDNANAARQAQVNLARTTAALNDANKHAEVNAALTGKLKEKIDNAPKHGCMGPAERALLDGLRTDALNRRSQIPEPVSTGDDVRAGASSAGQ